MEVEAKEAKAEVDLTKIESPVLRRLIEEVKHEQSSTVHNYDRIHNRHNRSGF